MAFQTLLNRDADVVVPSTNDNRFGVSAPASSAPTLQVFATKVANRLWSRFKHRRDSLMYVSRFAEFRDLGVKPLDQIDYDDLWDFRDHLGELGIATSTINRHMSALSGVFTHAVEARLLKAKPNFPKYFQEEGGRPRQFSDDEYRRLVAHFRETGDDWMADMVIVGCNTGMRKSEILSIDGNASLGLRAEISADGKFIYLPPKVTKTKKGRHVPLNADAAAAVHRLEGVVGQSFTHDIFYDRWWNAKQRICPGDTTFVFHVTRHTALSRMANVKKTNQKVISEIAGHASTKTTAKYVHGTDEAKNEAVDGLFGGAA